MACTTLTPLYGYANNPAWDSSFTMLSEPLTGDCYATFAVEQGALGVVFGLLDNAVSEHYTDIDYGIYFWQGKFQPVESGTQRYAYQGVHDGARWEYTVLRIGSTIYYTRRDVLIPAAINYDNRAPGIPINGELLYVSQIPSYGTLYLDSSFYGIGDSGCIVDCGSGTFAPAEILALVGGNATGELPIEGRAAGSTSSSLPITALAKGTLTIEGTASTSAIEGVRDGQLRLWGKGSDIDIGTTGAWSEGFLAVSGSGVGTVAPQQTAPAVLRGYLPLTGFASATARVPHGVYDAELLLRGRAGGSPSLDPALEGLASGELVLEGNSFGSVVLTTTTNYFQILLPGFTDSQPYVSIELTEDILISMEVHAQYVIMVREFITLVTTPQTFLTQSTELLDTATAVAQTMPQFSLWVQETLNITGTLDVVQVIELAEALVAAGIVQTVYQGTVAVLSAVLISDGGAGANPVGSGAILDATGTAGDPAELALYGWFPLGSVIGISYTANVGGPDSVSYTLTQHQTGEQVAQRLVALLDAKTYISSTYAGNGIIQILPANGATVVTV